MVFVAPEQVANLDDFSQWWQWVHGANWRHPLGPDSNLDGKENHPVVHIGIFWMHWFMLNGQEKDCLQRLREWAARGGLNDNLYTWGTEYVETEFQNVIIGQEHFQQKHRSRWLLLHCSSKIICSKWL